MFGMRVELIKRCSRHRSKLTGPRLKEAQVMSRSLRGRCRKVVRDVRLPSARPPRRPHITNARGALPRSFACAVLRSVLVELIRPAKVRRNVVGWPRAREQFPIRVRLRMGRCGIPSVRVVEDARHEASAYGGAAEKETVLCPTG